MIRPTAEKTPGEVLAPWIDRARKVVASTGSLNEAIETLTLEIIESGRGEAVAALALIQLAADEDFAGVSR